MRDLLKMISPTDIIKAARSLINTPYKHQGRKLGIGLDCLGVVELTALLSGVTKEIIATPNYSRDGSNSLQQGFERYCAPTESIVPGVIVLVKLSAIPYHCGIITDFEDGLGLLHAYENVGRVREHALIPWWKNKISHIYQFPAVNYGT